MTVSNLFSQSVENS
uniref:Uncharacterized protein n=1 Tax=Arundo donax TaxID=35708 RepID=A0A0A9EMT1_ARUDO